MPTERDKLRVLVVGGGIAALETVLALHEMAGERVAITLLAPNDEFVYRPLTVREPFAYARAARYPLASILGEAGAEHVADKLDHVDAETQTVRTEGGANLEYDALVLALGAKLYPRFEHAITIDDGRMDEALHGLIQDVEGGYLKSVAFVAPGRMAWPLPLYELALMTAGRASDAGVELAATIVTPEDEPLAVFGKEVSDGLAKLLADKGIRTITSAYAEIPAPGEVVISPGDRRLRAERVVALPELYGPAVRGLPVSEHGFIACRPLLSRPGRRARLRRRRRGRLPDQAGRRRLPAGRRGGGIHRRARGRRDRAARLRARHPRRPADRREAPLLRRGDHRRPRVRLALQQGADRRGVPEGRGEVPRSPSRVAGPARRRGMSGTAPPRKSRPKADARRRPRDRAKRRCLVVGYDGEEASRRAATWAASQLAPNGKLVLVHASRPLHAPASPLSTPHERHGLGGALFDELLLEGEAELLDTVVHTEVCELDPVRALTDAATRYGADGIVVGHEPHSRVRRAIGTVTTELLAHSPVPVTVIPRGDTGG